LEQENYGPTLEVSKEIHKEKDRMEGESFSEAQTRFAQALKDNDDHFYSLRSILLSQRFMGGGRTQAAVGSPRRITPFNCYVSGTIEDSFNSIMERATESGQTMRLGGGIGYDFSLLRPRGDRIVSLDSKSSGPISFMRIFNAICDTISSAGHRRGAQMGVLRVDHPDIEEFIRAKQNDSDLKAFNISVGITDEFMEAVKAKGMFNLRFEGKIYKSVNAVYLWDEIMRSTWDWAEPGVLYIDRINEMNNLYYCEEIVATNPCGEQPLPPYGACLLGSFNLVKYISYANGEMYFDYAQLEADIPVVVRAMDNIHDIAIFPLPEQKQESASKRRMGLGVTGVANAGEVLGFEYGSDEFLEWFEETMIVIRDHIYMASISLAKEKGSFPLFDKKKFGESKFIKTLPQKIQDLIQECGIRNSHLLSIAPTGTISLSADNVSGGIEPVFSHSYDRTIQGFDSQRVEKVEDYAYRVYKVEGKTASECTAKEHLDVLIVASQYVDSAVSKTINVSPDMPWEEFTDIYMVAWENGCKGCTTFNSGGKRFGILNVTEEQGEGGAEACYIDLKTGQKECS